MLFDVQAALSEILADVAANPANPAKPTPDLASLADLAGAKTEIPPVPFSSFSGISRPCPPDTVVPNSTISTGQGVQSAKVIPLPGYSPEAIRQGVAEAFEDWEAMNDPHDPRAWA